MNSEPANKPGQQAIAALDAGRPQQAIDLLQPACDSSCRDPQLWFLLGTALGMTGNNPAAEVALRACLQLNPDHIQAQVNLGMALSKQDKHNEAADILEHALTQKPGNRPVRIALINSLINLQQIDRADKQCGFLLENFRNDAEILTLQGKINKEKGEIDTAIACFNRALEANVDYVPAHMNKGLALKLQGKQTDALDSFTHASRLAPENPAIWYIKGMSHIATDNLEKAADDLEKAFRLNPNDIIAGSQLASVYRHMRRIPESVEVSKRILAADPGNVRARFYIDAFSNHAADDSVNRIPREVAEATYSQKDVGKNFEASLKGGLEYKAPDVLNEAVRDACNVTGPDLDILEIGCGTGLCGSRFADIARTLVGTDLSPSMLDVAREKNAYTDLYVADLIDVLSSNPGKFDMVIAMDVLCYFGDLTEIFQKCHDTLRPGGIFAFSVEKPDDDELWLLHPYGHFVHSLEHLRQAARNASFEETFTREIALRREALEQRIGYVCLYRRT